ncbi:hypothetical protein CDAR_96781 [Caerostris darwini]|uniref:Uncharacterized protein n=1 Tax=Caerostris darwini TaxID=1538125 RepID=A0AAV4QYD0_9ARAC|nr:hypothetical protein CDAR_96781 [Caerostris darwini]
MNNCETDSPIRAVSVDELDERIVYRIILQTKLRASALSDFERDALVCAVGMRVGIPVLSQSPLTRVLFFCSFFLFFFCCSFLFPLSLLFYFWREFTTCRQEVCFFQIE